MGDADFWSRILTEYKNGNVQADLSCRAQFEGEIEATAHGKRTQEEEAYAHSQ